MAEPRPGDDVEIWTGPPSRTTQISYALVRGLILVVADGVRPVMHVRHHALYAFGPAVTP